MCGIFGFIAAKSASSFKNKEEIIKDLATFSQTRGKDSSGIMVYDKGIDEYKVFKGSLSVKELINTPIVRNCIKENINKSSNSDSMMFVMGHSRLATNGSQCSQYNNQPVIREGIIAIHNGIIVNDKKVWEMHNELKRLYETDTESYVVLLDKYLKTGLDISSVVDKIHSEIEGTASLATVITKSRLMLLHSNNGSLYVMTDNENVLLFASEYYTLKRIAEKYDCFKNDRIKITNINDGSYCLCNYDDMSISISKYSSNSAADLIIPKTYNETTKIQVEEIKSKIEDNSNLVPDISEIANDSKSMKLTGMLEYNADIAKSIKRCTKCLLPETFPFIEFDDHGVCNYCHNYKIKNAPKSFEELVKLVEPYRSKTGAPDCIVPFSGGRDSTYALHLIKNELKLNPIAYTYDWGMVTDLGRRNIARVCGKLGVENIIVAADIRKKRSNIRKNLSAWLRKPHLGMLPLLMAGDKYFYYYVEKVKRETGIKLNIWGVNPMENTDFKVGFVGVSPDFDKKYIYSLSLGRKFKLISKMAGIVASNPYYINSSVFDTLGSFFSRSIMEHRDYFHLFDYYKWDEKEIDKLLSEEYNWEKAIDTTTTWRIGDGTAAFYNYVYFTVAGFSEHDAFRSNQIREGVITREEGLKHVIEENKPRYATIKWYLDIVGLDFEDVISVVNRIPKLYEKSGE